MKKIIFFIVFVISFGIIISSCNMKHETTPVKLYFVDAEMLRLIPIEIYINKTTPQEEAKAALNELIRGRDDNPKIRRLIPDIKRCMTVKVENNIAYVDIKQIMVDNHPKGRDLEVLTIYSIVNTLTGIDGIVNVRFTIDGKTQKDFMGYVDMRGTFIPDYFI